MTTRQLFHDEELAAALPPAGLPAPTVIGGVPRLRVPVRDQQVFTVVSLDDRLAPDHEARQVWDFVCQLDPSALVLRIKATPEAQEIDKLRCQSAEWVNAQARNRNLWFLPVRGLIKVGGIAELFALAHNLNRALQRLAKRAQRALAIG